MLSVNCAQAHFELFNVELFGLNHICLANNIYLCIRYFLNIKVMRHTEERYISLLTDFGFKRIFGTKPNKDLLIDFLNSLFNGEQVVKDVTFLNSEYVEISKFNKRIEELETNYDKWLFVLQNLSRLDRQPEYLKTAVFNRLFAEAEIAKFTRTELREYEDSLKAYRDIKNSLDSAEEKGKKDKAIEIAKNLLEMDMPIDNIMKATGLSLEEVKEL